LKTELWSAAASAVSTPRQAQAPHRSNTLGAAACRALSGALALDEPRLSLSAALAARSETHLAFQTRRAEAFAGGTGAQSGQDNSWPEEEKRYSHMSPGEFYLGERLTDPGELQAPRAPRGSGYSYPSYEGGLRPTLAEVLNGSAPAHARRDSGLPAAAFAGADVAPALTRRERIRALERGLLEHDEEHLRTIADGTFPLLGPGGNPLQPVPPVEPHDTKLSLPRRLRLLSHKRASKQGARTVLLSSELMNREVRDRPLVDTDPVREAAGREVASLVAVSPRAVTVPLSPAVGSGVRGLQDGEPCRGFGALKVHETEVLLQEAEALILEAPSEERWSSLASQLCARAYEVEPPDVLRMVRVVGAAAARLGVKTPGRKELLRAADHLLQTLTARLQGADLELVIEVLEVMGDTHVGSQVYLDMVMALALACHHRDCRALTAAAALRLATALGRVAASALRLRPKGVGGPGASTNAKVLEATQQRIAGGLADCNDEDLARLDGYYLARFCGEAERHAIVSRMAELEIGFRERTKQYLPLMVRLQESFQRELPDCFRWSLPRGARDWLERLKLEGLRESAPWSVGEPDLLSSARARLCLLRADTVAP